MEIKLCPKCGGDMFVVRIFMQNPESLRRTETSSMDQFFRCEKCAFETQNQ